MFSSTPSGGGGADGSHPIVASSYSNTGLDPNVTEASSTGVGLSVGGLVDVIGGGSGNASNRPNIGHTCGLRSRNLGPFEQQIQSPDSSHPQYHNQSAQQQSSTPTNVIPLGPLGRMVQRQDSDLFYPVASSSLQRYGTEQGVPRLDADGGTETTYFINPDGVMETVTTEAAAAATAAYGSHEQVLASGNGLPPQTTLPESSTR